MKVKDVIVYDDSLKAEVEHSVGRFYRWIILKEFGIKLQRPSNNEHVTIIDAHLTDKKFENRPISLRFLPSYYTNGNAIWLTVESKSIDYLRKYYKDFGRIKEFTPHFCIGYKENNYVIC